MAMGLIKFNYMHNVKLQFVGGRIFDPIYYLPETFNKVLYMPTHFSCFTFRLGTGKLISSETFLDSRIVGGNNLPKVLMHPDSGVRLTCLNFRFTIFPIETI